MDSSMTYDVLRSRQWKMKEAEKEEAGQVHHLTHVEPAG